MAVGTPHVKNQKTPKEIQKWTTYTTIKTDIKGIEVVGNMNKIALKSTLERVKTYQKENCKPLYCGSVGRVMGHVADEHQSRFES